VSNYEEQEKIKAQLKHQLQAEVKHAVQTQVNLEAEVDDLKTTAQLGSYAYPSQEWAADGNLHRVFAWHQPKGQAWNNIIYVAVAAKPQASARRSTRRSSVGDIYPIQGSTSAVTYTLKVEAETVTSCPSASSHARNTIMDNKAYYYTYDGDYVQEAVVFEFELNGTVAPVFTDDNSQLLYSALNAANLEADWSMFHPTAYLGCDAIARKAWLSLAVPFCSTDFYAMPQCRADCEVMASSCIVFKTMACSAHPTTGCFNYYNSAMEAVCDDPITNCEDRGSWTDVHTDVTIGFGALIGIFCMIFCACEIFEQIYRRYDDAMMGQVAVGTWDLQQKDTDWPPPKEGCCDRQSSFREFARMRPGSSCTPDHPFWLYMWLEHPYLGIIITYCYRGPGYVFSSSKYPLPWAETFQFRTANLLLGVFLGMAVESLLSPMIAEQTENDSSKFSVLGEEISPSGMLLSFIMVGIIVDFPTWLMSKANEIKACCPAGCAVIFNGFICAVWCFMFSLSILIVSAMMKSIMAGSGGALFAVTQLYVIFVKPTVVDTTIMWIKWRCMPNPCATAGGCCCMCYTFMSESSVWVDGDPIRAVVMEYLVEPGDITLSKEEQEQVSADFESTLDNHPLMIMGGRFRPPPGHDNGSATVGIEMSPVVGDEEAPMLDKMDELDKKLQEVAAADHPGRTVGVAHSGIITGTRMRAQDNSTAKNSKKLKKKPPPKKPPTKKPSATQNPPAARPATEAG